MGLFESRSKSGRFGEILKTDNSKNLGQISTPKLEANWQKTGFHLLTHLELNVVGVAERRVPVAHSPYPRKFASHPHPSDGLKFDLRDLLVRFRR
jgi:hypothetical protein